MGIAYFIKNLIETSSEITTSDAGTNLITEIPSHLPDKMVSSKSQQGSLPL